MSKKRLLNQFSALAAISLFMLPSAASAQDARTTDVFGIDGGYRNSVTVSQAEDGSWKVTTVPGSDPYVATTALTRSLTQDETTLTFEYKASMEADLEFFFSTTTGWVYAGGQEIKLGKAPATSEWTRVYVDITKAREEWKWGKSGQTMRMDPEGATEGLVFEIRDMRICDHKVDYTEGLNLKDGVIQLNSQADFEAWASKMNEFVTCAFLPDYDVDLNTDIKAASTKNCIVQNINGTFDAHNHTIDLDLHVNLTAASNLGVAFTRYLDGTFRNATFTGTVQGTGKYLTCVAQDLHDNSLVENVHSAITIISEIEGDGTHGGVAGRCEGRATLKNVCFSGKMVGNKTTSCGGLVGWVQQATIFESCLMIGDMSDILDASCNSIGRNQGNIIYKNVYAIEKKNEIPDSAGMVVTPEMLASGEVCFKLNGEQRAIAWFQNIGEDAVPTLDHSHKQVYADADFKCDGTYEGEISYSNTDTGHGIPDHAYDKYGVCENCGGFQPGYVTKEDGYFIIDTPEKLVHIAKYATTYPSSNIRITKDLDMSDVTADYTPIRGKYAGTFDGMHHTISNLIIYNPEENDQALIGLAAGCTVKNLTLDNTCSITGASYSAGFVGETSGGTITMQNLFMHGNVTGSGANIAGIYGCNMSSAATVNVISCGMSGVITGGKESGLITGWMGGSSDQIKDSWAIGSVTGHDNEGAAFARPNPVAKESNNWSIQGDRSTVGKLSEGAGESGELTWKLNGSSFENPTWFQNLDEGDAYPSLDSLRGIVYQTAEGYATLHKNDPESFSKFTTSFSETAKAFIESDDAVNYANTTLLAEYEEIVAGYAEANNLDDFIKIYRAEKAKKDQVSASITAYKNYEAAILEIMNTLDTRDDFSGDDRDYLEDVYLGENLEPGVDKKAPNGTYEYIMENRLLTVTQVNAEITRARELLRVAIANGYEAGTEITNVMTNADFNNGFNGWSGTLFTGSGKTNTEGSNMVGAEIWSAGAHNMYQEIIAAKTGIYELKVGGAYRPFDEQMSIQYYPTIYISGLANYLQADIEDYIPVEEAIDGVNCNLTGGTNDRAILNENGDTIGWAMHGTLSICKALEDGRYDNRIVINANEGDTLRIGIKVPYSGYGGNEWVGIGDIHLTYQGGLEEASAGAAIDRALEGMLKRANVAKEIETTSDANEYKKYPNYSAELKTRLAAAIAQGEAAQGGDAATKYAAIEELSTVFQAIVDCKKAYMHFFTEVEDAYSACYVAAELDTRCADLLAPAEAMNTEGMTAYSEGTLSTEEALECAIAKTINVYPEVDEDGVYHIANTAQYYTFSKTANAAGETALKVVLEDDIFMNNNMIINDFYGVFDGQGHTLTMTIDNITADNAAPIINLRGAKVKNLVVDGTIVTSYKYAAGVAAHNYASSTIDRVFSKVEITGNIAGDGTHGGVLAVNDDGRGTITNCIFSGRISGSANSNGGIVGWSGGSGTDITGCLVIANITADKTNGNIIARNNPTVKNCFYLLPYGDAPAAATQITDEQLINGFTAYNLNGGSTRNDVTWRQNLDGTDLHPVLDPTHKIVYMTKDSVYTNELQNEIEKHEGSVEDPYLVNTAEDMAILRRFMVPGRKNYVKLTADIDMANIKNWVPLNTADDTYNGKSYQNYIDFDGQGHVISNFTCTSETQSYNSFFGILNGDVRNVGFKDANVYSKASGTGILGGYMGHDVYVNEDGTKTVSSLQQVWVTGKLEVETGYVGGMIGNIGGPTAIKNCYTNIEIISNDAAATYVGGIVGRVRDRLTIDQAYAAGSITSAAGVAGGIIGGGHSSITTPGAYNNVVVWNNTDNNFGSTLPAADMAMPTADLLDVVFNADGTVTDQSEMKNEIEVVGAPKVVYNEQFKQHTLITEANDTTGAPISYLKVDYSKNDAMKEAILDGYTLEATFKILNKDMLFQIKPFSSQEGGGFGFEIDANGTMKHVAYTDNNGDKAYRIAKSGVTGKQDIYYHFVGVFDKATRKVQLYVNGTNKSEDSAEGTLILPNAGEDELLTDTLRWFGIGADPGGTVENHRAGNGGNFEIVNARVYNEPLNENVCRALYYKQIGIDFFGGDKLSNISYYDGNNFAALQQTVAGWKTPWQCDMSEGTYPTFDGTLVGIKNINVDNAKSKIYDINGIRVEKTTKGLYIINGKKVMVK